MKHNNLGAILSQLKTNNPPRKLDILIEASNIQWNKFADNDIDQCCEILLEISADAIIIIFDRLDLKMAYLPIFNKIYENIKSSDILDKSKEFKEYFEKYIEYVSEIESSL